jgi:hypothetical protein
MYQMHMQPKAMYAYMWVVFIYTLIFNIYIYIYIYIYLDASEKAVYCGITIIWQWCVKILSSNFKRSFRNPNPLWQTWQFSLWLMSLILMWRWRYSISPAFVTVLVELTDADEFNSEIKGCIWFDALVFHIPKIRYGKRVPTLQIHISKRKHKFFSSMRACTLICQMQDSVKI